MNVVLIRALEITVVPPLFTVEICYWCWRFCGRSEIILG